MYRLGDLSENDLRLTLRGGLFTNSPDAFGQRFWQRSREAHLTNVRGRREQRFFDIADDEYRRSMEATRPFPQTRPHRIGRGLRRRAEPLLAGRAIGVAAAYMLVHPRVRRRRAS